MQKQANRTPDWVPSTEDWEDLVDERLITSRRREAENKYRDLGSDQIKYLRKLAKTDLFFLTTGILGYDLLSERLHGHLCNWLAKTRGERYRSILLPRGHYKSTVVSIAEKIQFALPNDAEVPEYPSLLGPNIKILLAHENKESASRFLFEIVEAFRSNPLMLALFSDCIPTPKLNRMNKYELELPRDSGSKEPTYDTIGTNGAAQGRHYHRLCLDDIIGEAARDSETVMFAAIQWFDNINSLLTRLKIDGWDLPGTRWSGQDVYGHAIQSYGLAKENSYVTVYNEEDLARIPDGVLHLYARPAIENGQPIFPEEFSIEDLNRIRKNAIVWAAQYANNPKESGLTSFRTGWLKYYNHITSDQIAVFTGESARRVSIWDLDRVILTDPSMGETKSADEAGIIVTGTDAQGNIYILETIKKRHIPPDFIQELYRLHAKWRPRTISIERVNFSGIYKYWILEKNKEMGVNLPIYEYSPQAGGRARKSKDARILGLTNYFSSGQIYIQEGMTEFRDEYEWFSPRATSGKHLLDALAQGPEIWRFTMTPQQSQEYKKAEELVMAERSLETGY